METIKTIPMWKNLLACSIIIFMLAACQKEIHQEKVQPPITSIAKADAAADAIAKTPSFNLEVVLDGEGNQNGHIHFRQDADAAKIITLDTKVHNLLPNHQYLLQRAVDPANVVDGNCTSTSWLTLGHGLTPQSITTNDKGDGEEELWRDVSAVASGSSFDIHFRIIDAVSMAVVLNSDCYQYMVR